MRYDIGFLGGGQLARMSIQAAQRMGLTCLSLDPGESTPASGVAEAIQGSLEDVEAIAMVFRSCDRVTLENEFIPADAIRSALELAGVGEEVLTPGVETLATIQDKLLQRQALIRAGVPSPQAVGVAHGGTEAIEAIGFPMVLKRRFGGYDGRGTRYAMNRHEFDSHRDLWEPGGWLAEEFVTFTRELAVMVCRTPREVLCFPTMETVQRHHVCDLVFPGGADASEIAIAAVEALGGYGLFGVELFELEDGSVEVNEIAPRPHNTGHYTLDWGASSQFEQHVRMTMGLPLGSVDGRAVCMANLLGQEGAGDHRSAIAAAVADPCIRLHWYGKTESRPGRKMGHLNATGDPGRLVDAATTAQDRFYQAWTGTSSGA
ncbi:MAG TPA: ATP-grasp domain-containing protein [Fimbriimonadaceae bacterium]|nr:ATP-grasp domain-containing protein [Fimbriimonadaceae bacterium]